MVKSTSQRKLLGKVSSAKSLNSQSFGIFFKACAKDRKQCVESSQTTTNAMEPIQIPQPAIAYDKDRRPLPKIVATMLKTHPKIVAFRFDFFLKSSGLNSERESI